MSLVRTRIVLLLAIAGLALPATADARKRRLRKRMKAAVTEVLQPSIQGVMGGAHDLAADLDDRLGRQLGTVDLMAGNLVDNTNMALADRLRQVDSGLEARIVQVDASANNLVRNALGRLDEVSRKRIGQVGDEAQAVVGTLNSAAQKRLEQVDDILANRLGDVDNVVQDAIRSTDKALEARIEQVDEALGRRLGNVDAVLAKERLGLERTLIRVAIAAAACVFVVLSLWWLWRSFRTALGQTASVTGRGRRLAWLRKFAAPGGAILIGVFVAVTGLFWSVDRIPTGAQKDLAALVAEHDDGYARSLREFDFTRARFHASQLEILKQGSGADARGRTAKLDLIQLVFGRPTSMATPEGQAAVEEQIRKVDRALGDEPDPDVLVIEAFALWRTSESRSDEHRAASLCARALRLQPQGFALSPIAKNYIHNFLHAPFIAHDVGVGQESESIRALRALVGEEQAVPPHFPLRHMLVFNQAVRALEREATPAYLDMLEAHATLVDALESAADVPVSRSKKRRRRRRSSQVDALPPSPKAVAARTERTDAAQRVLDAWRAFESRIDDERELQTSPSILGLFRLNDAMLVRSLWLLDNENADRLAPRLHDVVDPMARARLAPPRVAWSREYATVLGALGHEVLDLQEQERFLAYEEATAAFDEAFVAARRESQGAQTEPSCDPGEAATQAHELAAELGLYVMDEEAGRVPLAWRRAAAVRSWLAPIAAHGRRQQPTEVPLDCQVPPEDTRVALSGRLVTLF